MYLNMALNLMCTFNINENIVKLADVCSGVVCEVLKILCFTKLMALVYFVGSRFSGAIPNIVDVVPTFPSVPTFPYI